MEATGYITRIVSVKDVYNNSKHYDIILDVSMILIKRLGAFIVQFLMVFLAPALMAASCYMAMVSAIFASITYEMLNTP